jgi:uncharacterized membrane protein
MVMIALCSSLIGAVLGTRFRVHVLFPAVLLGLVIVAIVAVIKETSFTSALAAVAIYAVSLQFGYLGGLFVRFCMTAVRTPSHRSLRSTTVRS